MSRKRPHLAMDQDPCDFVGAQLEEYQMTLNTMEMTCKRLRSELSRAVAIVTAAHPTVSNHPVAFNFTSNTSRFSKVINGLLDDSDPSYEFLSLDKKLSHCPSEPALSPRPQSPFEKDNSKNSESEPRPKSLPSIKFGEHDAVSEASILPSDNHNIISSSDQPLDLSLPPITTALTSGSISGHRYSCSEAPINCDESLEQGDNKRNLDDTLERFMKVDPSQNIKWRELAERFGKELAPNICGICGKTLSCKSALTMHYRVHTEERPFVCSICDKRFSTKGNLKTHLGQHCDTIDALRTTKIFLPHSLSLEQMMSTSLTAQSYMTSTPLRQQRPLSSANSLEEASIHYNYSIPSPSSQRLSTMVQIEPIESKFFKSNFYDPTAVLPDKDNSSIKGGDINDNIVEETERPLSNNNIWLGKMDSHNSESEPCDVQDPLIKSGEATGDSGIGLSADSFNHESDTASLSGNSVIRRKEYACETCGKSFPTRSALQIHNRSHTGEKPFHCSDCNKSFSTQGNMKTHREKHCPCRRHPSSNSVTSQPLGTNPALPGPVDCPPNPANWLSSQLTNFPPTGSNPFWPHMIRSPGGFAFGHNASALRPLFSFPDVKPSLPFPPWLLLPQNNQIDNCLMNPNSSLIDPKQRNTTDTELAINGSD